MDFEAYCVKCRAKKGSQGWHRQGDLKRPQDGPGYLSGMWDESDSLFVEQERGIRSELRNHNST